MIVNFGFICLWLLTSNSLTNIQGGYSIDVPLVQAVAAKDEEWTTAIDARIINFLPQTMITGQTYVLLEINHLPIKT